MHTPHARVHTREYTRTYHSHTRAHARAHAQGSSGTHDLMKDSVIALSRIVPNNNTAQHCNCPGASEAAVTLRYADLSAAGFPHVPLQPFIPHRCVISNTQTRARIRTRRQMMARLESSSEELQACKGVCRGVHTHACISCLCAHISLCPEIGYLCMCV